MNNVYYENVNLKPSTTSFTGVDGRPRYDRRDEIDDTYTYIILGSNTNKGYTYNITAQIQKPFSNGWTASLAYTYGDAYAVFDGPPHSTGRIPLLENIFQFTQSLL